MEKITFKCFCKKCSYCFKYFAELKKAILVLDPSVKKIMEKNRDIFAARLDAFIEVTQV